MAQNTNLNVTPYYDDFDKDKNFYRVLFRPGFPIQARELSTMQSILQNQVENVGTHFFKDGAMVIPGQVGYDLNVSCILLQESFLGSDVETYRDQLDGSIIEGLTTGIKAKVLYSISAEDSERGYITIYVKYIDSGDTTSASGLNTFQLNEQLIANKEITFGSTLIEIGTPFAQLLPVNATSVGSSAYISDGVYFIRGHFVNVPSSYIILEQYSSNPSYRVGLDVLESIVTPEDDESLNDNAAGTSNYSAPGGHRFKISTQFTKRLISDEADKDFIELLRINQSTVESFVTRTAYSELEKSLARRTFEESGDYVIDTFTVTPREHLNDGFNNGVYQQGDTSRQGNPAAESKLAIEVSPGKAYIKGYRTEFISPQYVDVDKPRDFDSVQNGIINFNLGNFIKVYDIYGWPEVSGDGVVDAYQVMDLYDDWSANATTTPKSGANQIGRCRVVQMQKATTSSAATNPFGNQGVTAGVYDMWFYDAQMWTAINIANAVLPLTVGSRIKGKTSGAIGYIASTGNNTHYVYLEQVSGIFTNNEILEIDGRPIGTLEAAWSYQVSDARSAFGLNATNQIRFGCNLILNDARPIEASTINIDNTQGDVLTADTIVGGSGYSDATGVATTGGNGSNLTVDITTSAGAVTGVTVNVGGSGYSVDETITITGGGADATFDVASIANSNITGFRTRFDKDLRPGDVVTPTISNSEGNNTVRIKRVDPANIGTTSVNKRSTVAASDVIFNYDDQTAVTDTVLTVGTVADGDYSELVRLRPFIFQKDYQNGELSFDLPEDVMKSLADESFFVFRNFASKTVTSGSITFTLPETEAFGALSSDNYILTVISDGGDTTFSAGDNLDVDSLTDGGVLATSFGAGNQSFSISGLGQVASVSLTALVSKNTVSKKVKSAAKMQALKVIKTDNDVDVQKTGLTYSGLYGTRVQDGEVSFGLNDVYHVHAIYESYNSNDAAPPFITLTESIFFGSGTLVTGKTSGARGRVISFQNTTQKLFFVNLNDVNFINGEKIEGFDANNDPIDALVDDDEDSISLGSKVITDQFTLDPGQRTNYYDVSRLVRESGLVSPNRRLLVIFDYFIHEASGDYFSAESYTGIEFKDIPNYKLDGSIKFIRDQADFRPGIKELRNGSGTISAPYFVNCTTFDFNSRVFNTSGGSGASTIFDIMQVNSSFRSDYSWYLARIDKLYVSHAGDIKISKGVSGKYLIPPEDFPNAMLVATLEYKPYVFDPERDVIIKQELIRRYTMKDIGDLEQRLTHVEYYTSLSLLESQADNTKTYDENGFDRLKNGYVVDDFTDHTVGAVFSPDYKCSLDFREGQLRPQHFTTNVALQYNESESTNIVKAPGNVLTLPYNDLAVITQPYASRTENVNPFNVFTFIGRVDLQPASDDWIDIDRMPARVENIEGDFSAVSEDMQLDQDGFAPIQWGSWQTNWTGETVLSTTQTTSTSGTYGVGRQLGRAGHGQRRQGLFYLHDRTTFRVVNNQARQGIRTKIVPKIDRKSLGDTILSTSAIPWIRSRNIGFNVFRLKPRTRFYAFFDGVVVTNYMTPKVIEIIKNSSTDSRTNETPFVVGETVRGETSGCQLQVVAPNDGYTTNPYGKGTETLPETYASQTQYLNHNITAIAESVSPDYFGNMQVGEVLLGLTSGARAVVQDRRLLTDNVGNIQGTFFVPSPKNDANPRWATGTRNVRFTTSETNNSTPGTVDSSAQATYSAQGTLQTVQENILAVRNAEVVQDTVSEERVVESTRTEDRQIGWYDPLAQSFIVEEDGGMFLTGVDIYFQTKDTNIPISMQIRTMTNGYPTKTILPFSDVTINPDQVEISESAAIPTRFTFRAPVYIKSSIEYCFVLLSDSNEYKVWISRMGDVDVTGTRTISEQPYAGVLFKSQNASTWTADQYEDLKFTVFRADFTETQGTVTLNNTPQGRGNGGVHRLISNPIQTIKPKTTLVLPAGTTYAYSVGARLKQITTNAEATVLSFDPDTDPDTLIVNEVDGNWLAGSSSTFNILSSQAIATLTLTGVTDTFEVGDVVTGGTSAATGEVVSFDSGTGVLVLNYVSAQFTATETVSEAGGGTGTAASIVYTGDSIGNYLTSAPTFGGDEREVLVYHRNHGMHSRSNNVKVEGIVSEVSSTILNSALIVGASSITVDDATAFHKTINGAVISDSNPGYLKVNDEIISYREISADGKTITVATSGRGLNDTAEVAHTVNSVVECYNLDGIPLIELNKTHTSISCPWLDTYMLHTTSIASGGIRSGGDFVFATQNVQFETLTPTISTLDFPETEITTRINTTSATSIGNGSTIQDQPSFVNDGSYADITINNLNFFSNPRMVCSQINEDARLSGAKSLTMKIDLSTEKSNLSPLVDLDRCSLITTSNRINQWPGGPDAYGQQSQIDTSQDVSTLPFGDQNDAVYITRLARLIRESRSIRVDFQMSRPPEAEIRIYYRVFNSGTNDDLNSVGWTLMPAPLQYDSSPSEEILWKDYYYEVSGLNFNAFQLKIVMRSSNQARVPLLADLRAIALAT